MQTAKLDEQISAYQDILPSLRARYGSVWALVADEKLIRTFGEFSEAARFVAANYKGQQVLIRHTDERMESAPFVQVGG